MKLLDNEIMPLNSHVLIRVINTNPYINRISESGLVLPNGATAYSQETGVIEELEQIIKFAIVVEVGPEVKTLKKGDEVFFNVGSSLPIPILDLGVLIIAESNVLAHIRGEHDHLALAEQINEELAFHLSDKMTELHVTHSNVGSDGLMN